MTRCNTFARSAVFAAGAAAGWLPWILTAGPLLGVLSARALYLVAVTTCYVAGLCVRSPRRITVACVAGLAAGGVALCARGPTELAIGLAVIIGLARSAFLYRAAPARAVVTEVLLLLGGLLFARALGGHGLASTALALWGFFLVGGVRSRPACGECADPFEEAHRRAVALLDWGGV